MRGYIFLVKYVLGSPLGLGPVPGTCGCLFKMLFWQSPTAAFVKLSYFVASAEEDLQGKTEEEIEMMKTMGFASFDTTKVSADQCSGVSGCF